MPNKRRVKFELPADHKKRRKSEVPAERPEPAEEPAEHESPEPSTFRDQLNALLCASSQDAALPEAMWSAPRPEASEQPPPLEEPALLQPEQPAPPPEPSTKLLVPAAPPLPPLELPAPESEHLYNLAVREAVKGREAQEDLKQRHDVLELQNKRLSLEREELKEEIERLRNRPERESKKAAAQIARLTGQLAAEQGRCEALARNLALADMDQRDLAELRPRLKLMASEIDELRAAGLDYRRRILALLDMLQFYDQRLQALRGAASAKPQAVEKSTVVEETLQHLAAMVPGIEEEAHRNGKTFQEWYTERLPQSAP